MTWPCPHKCPRPVGSHRASRRSSGIGDSNGPGGVGSTPGPGTQERRSKVQQERTRPAPEPVDGQARVTEERLTYTLSEAAARLGISRALAYEAAHRGELPVCRIGRRMLVPRAALARLLNQDDTAPDARSA